MATSEFFYSVEEPSPGSFYACEISHWTYRFSRAVRLVGAEDNAKIEEMRRNPMTILAHLENHPMPEWTCECARRLNADAERLTKVRAYR